MRMKKSLRVAYKTAIRRSILQKGNILMPTKVEAKLREEAEKKFPGDKPRQDRYIYGTMRKQGWKPEREKVN
jgi:hypothetical protein